MAHRSQAQKIYSPRDVLKGSRPAASRVAEPTVLDVPRGDAASGKRRAQMRSVAEIVARAPEATVDDDGDRVRPSTVGEPQVAEVQSVRAIGETESGGRGGKVEDCEATERAAQHFSHETARRGH